MEAPPVPSQPFEQTSSGPTRGQRHNRPRRGRGNANASLSFRPSSIGPDQTPTTLPQPGAQTSSQQHDSASASSRSRGRARGRGGRATEIRTVNGRQFGGRLTTQDNTAAFQSNASAGLQADAPAFVPGRPTAQRQAPTKQPQTRRPQRRASKSQAPDIATRTHEDIDHGHYECPICTSEVRRNSKVWSCHTCWTVFHLTCIKKWSSNEGSTAAQSQVQDGQSDQPRQWRCPGCNLPKDETPKLYACWCGKETDPKPVAGLPPHSCGNTCGKERAKKCPHHCDLTCHAGPCPPCAHIGPTQVCFCGKHEVTKRCSQTDYDTGWSCGEVCGEVMPCGEHTCPQPCHEGLCGACEVRVPARCYCGRMEKDVICDELRDELESKRTHASDDGQSVEETWTGSFDCENVCGRPFDCGEHHCDKTCHTQEAEAGHCPRSPDVVTHCPCGKTPLAQLSDTIRKSCTDLIPHCPEACGAVALRQGQFAIKERRSYLNAQGLARFFLTVAGTTVTSDVVLSMKKKQRPFGSVTRNYDDLFEAEHICTLACGRLLKCGTHYCQELCHRGPCGTCREAIFEEISCHCGRTVLQPPLPCGTNAPPCRYPCNRSKTCGHPQVPHNCHEDDEACPKCPFLIEKHCMCGKKKRKHQQCWLQDVRCGEICGKLLRCGSHHCRKLCHRPGDCEDADGQSCQQPCGKPKKACGHPDMENACHAPFPCKEEKPCQSKIYIMCDCQAQKQEMKCGASKSNEGNTTKTLPCNEECQRLERNRKLALALNIDTSAYVEAPDHIPYSPETLTMFAEHFKWAQTQEREFRVFAASQDERRLRFKPMRSHERQFLHVLAKDFGFESEGMDPEPHRHVMIWKTPKFVSAPHKTLAEALRIRQLAQKSATASANVSDNEGTQKTSRKRATDEPLDAFVIAHPKFGLTIDELRSEVERQVHDSMGLTFDIEFLPSEEVVLKAQSQALGGNDLEQVLQCIKLPLITAISTKGYGSAELCATDSSLNILRRESDGGPGDGWSKVAAKKSAPRGAMASGVGSGAQGGNAFSALGDGKVTFAKKKVVEKVKPRKTVVVDDWMTAELAEEEKEKERASGASDDEGVDAVAEDDEVAVDGDDKVKVEGEKLGEELADVASDHEGTGAATKAEEKVQDEQEASMAIENDSSTSTEATAASTAGEAPRDWADQVTESATDAAA